jgi:hypothetical protein
MDGEYAHTHLRMNDRMRQLKGSPLRDLFKLLHKRKLPSTMFGCDLDFVIVEKNPDCIIAFLDVKVLDEGVTFSEVIAYNKLLAQAPLYLLYTAGETTMEQGEFKIFQYVGGNRGPNPPAVNMRFCTEIANWNEYRQWEQGLRDASKRNGHK